MDIEVDIIDVRPATARRIRHIPHLPALAVDDVPFVVVAGATADAAVPPFVYVVVIIMLFKYISYFFIRGKL
jgi:hypothetical protein